MKLFLCIVLLFAFSATSFAAIARGFFLDPKHPGKCTIKDDFILSPGDIVKDPDADCTRILCGNNGEAEFQTCGVEYFEGCTLGDYVDKSLPYPQCCKKHLICA